MDHSTHIHLNAAMAQSETITQIINIAITAEALAVTLLGAALANAKNYTGIPQGGTGLPANLIRVLQAAQAAEQDHYTYLAKAGAKPLTLSFTIPNPKIATDYTTLFSTVEALETAFISAYEAAALAFAEMRRADLVKVAAQVAGVEAEHRALARLALGDSLPHNVAFESAQFTTVGAAAAALQKLGFIGGSGQTVTYATYAPSVNFAGIINNTPGGVMASATAASTPAQMPSTMPHTGAGGMANHSTFPLWTLPAVVLGAGGAALLGIRTRQVKSGR